MYLNAKNVPFRIFVEIVFILIFFTGLCEEVLDLLLRLGQHLIRTVQVKVKIRTCRFLSLLA
jgi:hypothetical protein